MATPPPFDKRSLRRAARNARWVHWLSRRWLVFMLVFLFLYVGLALTAPVLMHTGHTHAADALYKLYAPLCHQFALRSWFFFGEQPAYPRAVSDTDWGTFEEYASRDPFFEGVDLYQWTADLQLRARAFRGNEEMGYKAALCQRDIAIYSAMFLFGLLFTRVRRWLRPTPLWLYLILGLMPIGLDGFSQLFSYPPFEFWPVRETLPIFRTLTGALFGAMNGWLAFPYLEESMREISASAQRKIAHAEALLVELRAEPGSE